MPCETCVMLPRQSCRRAAPPHSRCSYCVGTKAHNAGVLLQALQPPDARVSPRCAAAAMTEIMKTQVELALQNRHVPPSSQAEPAAATGMAPERSKAEKLQDAMEAEAKQRTRHIHDDRKRKFNSLDAGAKEVTGGVALLPRRAAAAKLFSWGL